MEDAEDYELEEEQKTYPQYDDMNYDDLSSNFDELTNRLQSEVKYGSDPLVATDLNNELSYVKKLMEETWNSTDNLYRRRRRNCKHFRTIRKHNRSKR